jgi:hypothetical protein
LEDGFAGGGMEDVGLDVGAGTVVLVELGFTIVFDEVGFTLEEAGFKEGFFGFFLGGT